MITILSLFSMFFISSVGGLREGSNLFSNCNIALDAETGKMKWHFQAVQHDLWDRDFPCPPNLTTINHNLIYISIFIGSFLTRLPVRSKIALANAGATVGKPASPAPSGGASLSRI